MIRHQAHSGTIYGVNRSSVPGLILLHVQDGPDDSRAVLLPEHALHIIRLLTEQLERMEKEAGK